VPKKIDTKPPEAKKPVRLMSGVHLSNLEPGRLCGCQRCLREAGLEMVEIINPETGDGRAMLVDWFSAQCTQRVQRETAELGFPGSQAEEE
jgi:hypothetical protein